MTTDTAQILHEVKAELHKVHSPWRNRAAAALYCYCSESKIDKAADEGHFKRYKGTKTPMFKTAELDAWVEAITK